MVKLGWTTDDPMAMVPDVPRTLRNVEPTLAMFDELSEAPHA